MRNAEEVTGWMKERMKRKKCFGTMKGKGEKRRSLRDEENNSKKKMV